MKTKRKKGGRKSKKRHSMKGTPGGRAAVAMAAQRKKAHERLMQERMGRNDPSWR